MTIDIKELQRAIAAEVNRREYERAAGTAQAPTQPTQLPNDLVRAFELVDIERFLPPAPEQPVSSAPAAAVPPEDPSQNTALAGESDARSLYGRLRSLPVVGRYFGHPRVINLLHRARQRPGNPVRNVIILLARAVLYRVPGLEGMRHRYVLLKRLPEIINALERFEHQNRLMEHQTVIMSHHNIQLRNVGLKLQTHLNQSLYTHALAIEQNEQSLAVRQQILEQRLRELMLKPAVPQPQANAQSSTQTAAAPVPAAAEQTPGMPHDLYLAFEAEFRGSRELIRERLAANLRFFNDNAKRFSEPVMDIGCGRGEWLQLLKEAGIAAIGVDTNTAMIQCCTEAGLEAYVGDALQYMQSLPDNSLAGLTAFHIIEHVPLDVLIQIIDEAKRVVRPGGVVLLETPNPENLIVGSCNFYVDPTHRNPLPPALVGFLLRARGFERVEIDRRHPADPALLLKGDDEQITAALNRILFGAQDYAAIGYVPEKD